MTDRAVATRLRAIVVDDEPLARAHLRSLLEGRPDVEVVGECGDGRSAVTMIDDLHPDLVLLDVQMPELDGLEVVRAVGVDQMPAVVFVTAYDEHALAAFELHAFDYILKPVNRARFTSAIDRIVGLVRSESVDATRRPLTELVNAWQTERGSLVRLAVRGGGSGRVLFVRVADIDWIEADDDQVKVHTRGTTHVHRSTLTHLEQRLPPARFLRVHRSILVNVDRIQEIQPWFQGDWLIVLADGTKLQSGKSYRSRVREFIERQM
jgi:two-component system, LytTR family, response regulator